MPKNCPNTVEKSILSPLNFLSILVKNLLTIVPVPCCSVTSHLILSFLKQQKYIISQSYRLEVQHELLTALQSRCWQGYIPFWRLSGEPIFLFLLPASRGCPNSLSSSKPAPLYLHDHSLYIYIILFIDLFLAVLGFCGCKGFSLVVVSRGYSLVVWASHCSGFFCCGAQALGSGGFSSCGM